MSYVPIFLWSPEPQTVQQSQSQDQQNFVTKASSSNTNNVEEMQRIINELSVVFRERDSVNVR